LARSAYHGKDEALRLKTIFMDHLPVPACDRGFPDEMKHSVRDVIASTKEQQAATSAFFDWLATKLGTERVTQKLEAYWQLDAATLEAEARRAGAPALTPAAKKLLSDEHARQVTQLKPLLAETRRLEIELQYLVFDLYGLTPEEVQLLRTTAPPRDPLALVEAAANAAQG
jgi:hypothetical protein